MPYPNTTVLNIVIPQTSASIQDGQAPFVERIISGSRLILQTTIDGTLTGSSDLNVNSITASNISASGYISASALRVETSIVDGGTLTVLGNTVLGDVVSDIIQITGSTSLSGSFSVVGASTFNGLVSASAGLTASAIQDAGTLTVVGNTIVANLSASNISASRIVASEITASSELFIGTGTALRTYGEAFAPENLARLYVSGSVSITSKYATLNLATSASSPGAQSSILFSRLADRDPGTGLETVLEPRMQLGTESGSTDLRIYGYYSATDPDTTAQAAGSNIVAGTRAIFKQSGYFGVGNFISYGAAGGATTTYVSSLPGYAGIVGPDAMLTILPMDSASFGSAGSKQYNRNILNIMSYDTSSIMFISGSDGYVLLGKNTTDGINRLQVAGNISASAYTGSSAIITNITASNISASGNISASTLRVETSIVDGGSLTVLGSTILGDTTADTTRITGSASISGSLSVVGNTTLQSTFVTNLTASNISASGFISGSDGIFAGDVAVNGGDITTTVTGTATLFNTNATSVTIGGASTGQVLLGNSAGTVKSAGDFIAGTNIIKDGAGGLSVTVTSALTTIAGDLRVDGQDIQANGGNVNLTLGTNELTVPVELVVSQNANATSYTDTAAALQVAGGARISKDTWISGSLNVAGDLTIFGSSSVVYISSSTVIINDNIIQLNAFFPFERYAGIEVFDSGSNQRSASLLWDGHNDNWITVDQNNSSSNVIVGPTASFGTNPGSLTANNIPKAYDATGIADSLISDDGTTLLYTGTRISASSITASNGALTNISGALITYVTGSFTALTVVTGSSPGVGSQVPTSPTSAGMPGQIEVDNNFIYVYTNNIWKRVPLSTWSL